MGHAYAPGLTVTRAAPLRRTRRLPIAGEVVVAVGDEVRARQVVARTALPGKVAVVNVATGLGILPEEVAGKLVARVGDAVRRGEPIARTASLFGWLSRTVVAPTDGTLEALSAVTGMAVVREPPSRLEVTAYVDGTVVDVVAGEAVVVAAHGTLVQGIFGLGGERHGAIAVVAKSSDHVLDAPDLRAEHRGKVVLGGARTTLAAMRRAFKLEVAAIVCGAFGYQDLRELLGYDVGVAVTGDEPLATTLVLTEGFGDLAMAPATYDLLAGHDGRMASVNGATQIRAGVIRPEIVVTGIDGSSEPAHARGLEVGSPVRCLRAPYFGRIGTVASLPVELVALPTEASVRVVEVELGDAGKVILPRANVEVIEA